MTSLTEEQKQELARLAEAWNESHKLWPSEWKEERTIMNTVPALLAEIESLRPDALKMREINAKAEALSAQFNADYHFGLPQAQADSLNKQLKIAIEALERCDHCNCRHGHPDHSLHKEDCPYRIAREALRKLKPAG